MARRSRMSMLKRQRELRKAEKAARKRAQRHGLREEGSTEPVPTVKVGDLLGGKQPADGDAPEGSPDEGTDRGGEDRQ